MKPGKISLKDVAAKAEVSLAAASYALRPGPRQPFISEATQKRVLQVAKGMGFRVNASARSLRSNKRYSIAIICGQLRDRSAITAVESIIAYLSDTPYAGVVATCAQVKNLREYVLRHLDSHSHDAVIFIRDDRMITPELLKSLVRAGMKVAAIMPTKENLPHMPFVYLNRPRAAAMMVEVLASQGHQDIDGVLPQSAPSELVEQMNDAATRLKVRLKMHPLEIEPNDVNEFRVGVEIARSHLHKSKASAVAVFYENLALGVVQGLSLCGIQVPEHRSVLAYGSSSVFEANEPPISAVSHPIEEIGRIIAGSTIEWIEADFDPQAIRVSPFTPVYFPRSTVRKVR
jgi:DNA-binding LacI/PurR family transcriptional regulator